MDDQEIYSKTEAGREEIRTRALHLAGALRTVLLLVDGQRTVVQLKELMAGGKAPPDALDQLAAQGLIALVKAAPAPAPQPLAALRPSAPSATPPAPVPAPAPARAATPAPSPAPARAQPEPPAPAPVQARPEPPDSLTALSVPTEAAQRFNRLYTVMNEVVRDYLGLRGYFMTLKIERCSSAEELLDLQGELEAALAKGHGAEVATELISRIRNAA